MDNVKELILKILKYKSDSGVDEIKVDLQRICSQEFGNSQEDIGYVNYLFKYYSKEIVERKVKISVSSLCSTF